MAKLDFKKYEPSEAEKEVLSLTPFWYAYATGEEIVCAYGNVLPMDMRKNTKYLIITELEDHNETYDFRVYSDKWPVAEHIGVNPDFLAEDGLRHFTENFQRNGSVCNLRGRRGMIVYMFKLRAVLFFDVDEKQMYVLPHYGFRNREQLQEDFERIESVFGDLSEFYSSQFDPVFQPIDTRPCGEYASFSEVEYAFLKGWQIVKYLKQELKKNAIDSKATYLVFRRKKVEEDKWLYILQSNKWAIEQKNKNRIRNRIAPEAKEINSIRNYRGEQRFGNQPCKLNKKKVIICYPMSVYNPVIWDVEDDSIWVLTTKRYPDDEYYKSLEEHFGKITFL